MKRNTGFTLIEVILVVAIIVILTSSGLIVSINNLKVKSLENAESMLKTGLIKARDEAFFGKKIAGCNDIFNGNTLKIEKDGKGYLYKIMCRCGVSEIENERKYFGENILVEPVDGGIFFKTVKRDIDVTQSFSVCINNGNNECDENFGKRVINVDNYGNFNYEKE